MSADVGVGELVEELEQRGARLPFEIGAFVALEACEGLLRQSVKIAPDDVRVTLDGAVLVAGSAERSEPEEAARSLVSVLARLLIAAGPGVPPDLLQLVKEATTGQRVRDLRDLHDAIEASLIPINRGASRRVLARLVRESDRPAAAEEPDLDPRELDAELDELLRDPITRTPGPARTERTGEDVDDDAITERIRFARPSALPAKPAPRPDPAPKKAPARATKPEPAPPPSPAAAALAVSEAEPSQAPEPITRTIRKWNAPPEAEPMASAVSVSVSIPVTEPELQTPTESVFGSGSVTVPPRESAPPHLDAESARAAEAGYDRPSRALPRSSQRRSNWGIWVFAGGLGLVIYAGLAAGAFDRWLRDETPAAAPSPTGVIEVQVSPPGAQVLVFVGRGPTVSEGLPVDVAHEFVVFDKGLQPTRAIVPEGATWTATDDGPLYELAIQAQPAAEPPFALDLGSPQTEPAPGAGPTGTVRIITNPPGAKVYRFVARGPSASIRVASIHEGREVLVYEPGHEARRAVIGPSDWQSVEGPDAHRASLEIELPELPASAALQPAEQ
jgi:hypothetical protein